MVVVARLLVAAVLAGGCRGGADAERRAAAQATAVAEERAQETTLTAALLEADAARGEETFPEVTAAFRLEQSDFRGRLERALDVLDRQIVRARRGAGPRSEARLDELRARRDLLKTDLDAVARSTEPDWATLRTKVDRDLAKGAPAAQQPPRSERTR